MSTPVVTPRGHNTPIAPRSFMGDSSVRYMGTILVARPRTNKYNQWRPHITDIVMYKALRQFSGIFTRVSYLLTIQ